MRGTTKQILREYQGKINFAYRQFPLEIHKNAYVAALSSEAAGGQGKFWEMYDKLFENQDEWSNSNKALEVFIKYAKELGLDTNRFKRDVENKTYDDLIKADVSDAGQLGINSTPTYYIGDKIYPGAISYDNFKKAIEEELKNNK